MFCIRIARPRWRHADPEAVPAGPLNSPFRYGPRNRGSMRVNAFLALSMAARAKATMLITCVAKDLSDKRSLD